MTRNRAILSIVLAVCTVIAGLYCGWCGYLQYQYRRGWNCADVALFTSDLLDKTRIPYRIVYGDDLKDNHINNAHVWIDLELPGGKAISLDWYGTGTKWNRTRVENKTQLIQWAKNN